MVVDILDLIGKMKKQLKIAAKALRVFYDANKVQINRERETITIFGVPAFHWDENRQTVVPNYRAEIREIFTVKQALREAGYHV